MLKKRFVVVMLTFLLFLTFTNIVKAEPSNFGNWASASINWAKACYGRTDYDGWCLRFVAACYRLPDSFNCGDNEGKAVYGSAVECENALRNQGRLNNQESDGWKNAPRGSMLFFNVSSYGHVVLYLGDSKYIETSSFSGEYGVRERTLGPSYRANYRGWAYPLEDWRPSSDKINQWSGSSGGGDCSLPPPENLSPRNTSVSKPITLRWGSVSGARNYKLRLYDSNMNFILERQPEGTDFGISGDVSEGSTYYWSIAANCQDGKTGRESEKVWFYVNVSRPSCETPTPYAPTGDITTTYPSFDWSQTSDIPKYYLDVDNQYYEASFQPPVRLPIELSSGSHYWRVKSICSNGESEWSSITYFYVNLADEDRSASNDLTENNAYQWKAWESETDYPYTGKTDLLSFAEDDYSTKVKGDSSILLTTAAGFDVWMEYPSNKNFHKDLSNAQFIHFSVMTENFHLLDGFRKFQFNSPWIKLCTTENDYYIYQIYYEFLDDTHYQWKEAYIPIYGDETWYRYSEGSPSLSNINWIEFHVDTWDYGFRLWLDDFNFGFNDDYNHSEEIPQKNVLVLNFDPVIEIRDNQKLHQVCRWNDPVENCRTYINDIYESSYQKVDYNVKYWIDLDEWPKFKTKPSYDDSTYVTLYEQSQDYPGGWWNHPKWKSMLEDFGFDYEYYIDRYNLIDLIEARTIDEVYIIGGAFWGGYESQMVGSSAYWCNSPPIIRSDCERNFVIMMFSYERGVDCMLENYGHRVESIMSHVFGRWDNNLHYSELNDWEKFTLYDKQKPGLAVCGNVHFAPNSDSDYDWGNTKQVYSGYKDWMNNYPNLTGEKEIVSKEDWGNGDMRLHHKWWFSCIPHMNGKNATNGIKNNWWYYIALV